MEILPHPYLGEQVKSTETFYYICKTLRHIIHSLHACLSLSPSHINTRTDADVLGILAIIILVVSMTISITNFGLGLKDKCT